ncbi:hypothetical protein F53441_8035 [Fusarium austroafricanum]|uniref:Chromo domain-containing protein n=1 Tax=Fusarium austroafricanum TaxID=2364996 RepID=A0A8H4KFX5_9HYPO|nr:hypothetical protein F53441_8035 [Fusarium austroafricanum]
MTHATSTPDTLAIPPSPLDDVSRRWIIIDHKIDTVSNKDFPFVSMLICGSKSNKKWEGWVDERFVHEAHEGRLLDYWKKVGGRDAQGIRETSPLQIYGAIGRREGENGLECLVQYVGYARDDFYQWEPEQKVSEAGW